MIRHSISVRSPRARTALAHHGWVDKCLAQNGKLTLDELCVELSGRGVMVIAPVSDGFSICWR
ncbi:hypothetical protein ACFSE1_18455 [Rhizobium helianthi]|uniref:Uncharacterized protein n=1 Tax=Rhizobium helianthi TaxID=1132695 RepID=A0ABW4M7L7_9HYPH